MLVLLTVICAYYQGSMGSPYLWKEAHSAADCADMIICLGTSLKVLRKYSCLWCMDRPKQKRPSLYIVNLQWTPKDLTAELKIRGELEVTLTVSFLV